MHVKLRYSGVASRPQSCSLKGSKGAQFRLSFELQPHFLEPFRIEASALGVSFGCGSEDVLPSRT